MRSLRERWMNLICVVRHYNMGENFIRWPLSSPASPLWDLFQLSFDIKSLGIISTYFKYYYFDSRIDSSMAANSGRVLSMFRFRGAAEETLWSVPSSSKLFRHYCCLQEREGERSLRCCWPGIREDGTDSFADDEQEKLRVAWLWPPLSHGGNCIRQNIVKTKTTLVIIR